MTFAIEILTIFLVMLAVGTPLVNTFDKWKKEMEKEYNEEK